MELLTPHGFEAKAQQYRERGCKVRVKGDTLYCGKFPVARKTADPYVSSAPPNSDKAMPNGKSDPLPFFGAWLLGSLILLFIVSWLVMYIVYWVLSLTEMLFLCLGDHPVEDFFSPPLGAVVCEATGWQCWGWILVAIWTIICIAIFWNNTHIFPNNKSK